MSQTDQMDSSKFPPEYWDQFRQIIRSEIKKAVDEKFVGITTRLDTLESQLTDISKIQISVKENKTAIDKIRDTTIPDMSDHMKGLLTACALQSLDLHTHHRKFALTIHGVKGDKEEKPEKTRHAVINLAKTHLKVDAKEGDFAACHRNGPAAGSSIHARFLDLSVRDKWLWNAKKLAKSKQEGISISVDVPPCLRKVKKELLDIRKALPDERKKRSFVKHLPSWPYFELIEKVGVAPNISTISTKHSFSKDSVVLASFQLGVKDFEGPLDFVIK